MTERPILFSAPMVQAILAGRKTQTRRTLKVVDWTDEVHSARAEGPFWWPMAGQPGHQCGAPIPLKAALCQPGDTLWVKENYRLNHKLDAVRAGELTGATPIWYEADGYPTKTIFGKQRPSIFMTRWASRITLACTAVRVERLNDCSNDDAEAEGVEWETADPPFYYVPGVHPHSLTAVETRDGATASYAKLWDHINGAGAWAKNPLVWVISFERVS